MAIICDKTLSQSVLGYNPVNDRIITIRIQGNPINSTIIQVYPPAANADDEERDAFYGKLQETLASVPKADVLIVLGDMNAKIGEEGGSHSAGKHGLGCRKEAGNILLEFCESNDLKIMNTFFKQPKIRLYT